MAVTVNSGAAVYFYYSAAWVKTSEIESLDFAAADATTASDDATGDGGSAATFARSDHKHAAQGPSADSMNAVVAGTDGLHYVANATDAEITAQTSNKMLDAARVLDEDDLVSDSPLHIATQQSITTPVVSSFPAGFADTSYSVTFTATGGGNGQNITALSKSTISVSSTCVDVNGTPQNSPFNWIAVGVKP